MQPSSQLSAFLLLFMVSVSLAFGQDKQKQGISAAVTTNLNTISTKIAALGSFKLPYAVEVFAANERDDRSRVIVRGWDVKGKIVSSSSSGSSSVGGAASASYAATGRSSLAGIQVSIVQAETGDKASTVTDQYGNFSLTLSHDTLHTIYVNGVEYGHVKLMKTKHDTVKNSINNVR